MKNVLLIIFFLQVILLSGCGDSQIKSDATATLSDDKIKVLLNSCDEEQGHINMPTIPSCYFSAFKDEGWTEEDVIKYIKEIKGIADIEEKIKSNNFWKEAWEENYG